MLALVIDRDEALERRHWDTVWSTAPATGVS